MKLRITVGVILTVYALIGFTIQFVPSVQAYYSLAVSTYQGNQNLISLLKFFEPFHAFPEDVLWFTAFVIMGFMLISYRQLLTKEKPPWITKPISQQKSLG